jgi:hypothetical protein
MRLGRPKSRLVFKKNRPSSHAHAQWDIALFSVRLALPDRLHAEAVEVLDLEFRIGEGLRIPAD